MMVDRTGNLDRFTIVPGFLELPVLARGFFVEEGKCQDGRT